MLNLSGKSTIGRGLLGSFLVKLIFMVGCGNALASGDYPQYRWFKEKEPAKQIIWKHYDNFAEFVNICKNPLFLGCADMWAEPCVIHSRLTEAQAMWQLDFNGMSHYDHERKHCMGWNHNDIQKDYPEYFKVKP